MYQLLLNISNKMDRAGQARYWHSVPKGLFRLCFILVNNFYCIPTYVVWMVALWPLRIVHKDLYWKIEGQLFQWLLSMVSLWSWWAGYDVEEVGDDITECLEKKTLVIANHQSTADVPLLMATWTPRKVVLPNIMWIMDSLFKYTNFGIVSVMHQDFFIMSGKSSRDKSLQALTTHIMNSFIPNKRNWMVLFPEGGFLRKRKEVSQRYAKANNLPHFNHVTVPRFGALQIITNTMGHMAASNNNSTSKSILPRRLEWILDITIAYPNGEPLGLDNIVFGDRIACKTIVFYRLYRCKDVPQDNEGLTKWLFDRWVEKETMLEEYYTTGKFPAQKFSTMTQPPQVVEQDRLRFLIFHIFFIVSTYIHLKMAYMIYQFFVPFVY